MSSLVNFNTVLPFKALQSKVDAKNSKPSSIFAPAPSTETAGSIASVSPASGSGSFNSVC